METVKLATTYAEFDTDAYYKAYRTTLTSQGNIKENFRFIIDSLHEVFGTDIMTGLREATSYDEFNTDAYYTTYKEPFTSTGTVQEYTKFILDSLHDVFTTGSISGDRLLDVGTGGSLISFLSASRYVKEIHLSDLLPRHRHLLQRWLEGEDRDREFIAYIMDKENDGTTCGERVKELRRKVSYIHFIDVTKCPPLQEADNQYDVVTSIFCLEVATTNIPDFKKALANVGTLVKRGGYMVLVGTLQEKFYVVGNLQFWNACITETDVKSALKTSGFSLEHWRTRQFHGSDIKDVVEFDAVFIAISRKIV